MKQQVTLLTEHARPLLSISTHPEWTVRQIAHALDTSERQVFRWLNDLQRAGYLTRVKEGRRNRYVLTLDAPLHEVSADGLTLSELLGLAARQAAAGDAEEDMVEAHRLPPLAREVRLRGDTSHSRRHAIHATFVTFWSARHGKPSVGNLETPSPRAQSGGHSAAATPTSAARGSLGRGTRGRTR